MVKMGWTASSDQPLPVFTAGNRSNDTESRCGLGFVREQGKRLDSEVSLKHLFAKN